MKESQDSRYTDGLRERRPSDEEVSSSLVDITAISIIVDEQEIREDTNE